MNSYGNTLKKYSLTLDRSGINQTDFNHGITLTHWLISSDKKINLTKIFTNKTGSNDARNIGFSYGIGEYLPFSSLPYQLYIALIANINAQKKEVLKLSLGPSFIFGTSIHLHKKMYFQAELEYLFLNNESNYDIFNLKIGASILMKNKAHKSSLHVKMLTKKVEKIKNEK